MAQDVYQKVTDKIIADLEQGELTWLKPWSAGNMDGRIIKPLRHNGVAYSGINVLMLWGAALEQGYCSPYWMTFRQAKELGAHVRKGERGNPVIYARTITKTEDQDDAAACSSLSRSSAVRRRENGEGRLIRSHAKAGSLAAEWKGFATDGGSDPRGAVMVAPPEVQA